MVVTSITNYVLFGSSTDTKPLAGIAAQTLYFEIDTGRVYKFTGGVWSLFSGDNKPETLTNKTLTTPTITSIKTATGNVNIPAGPQTLIGTSTTDTLTNKTLISPTISTINNGGVITLPSGTRTLMARDTNDTVLNKTINVNSNTLSATSQAVGDILVNNGTQFLRLARGTNGQILTSTATSIQWSSAGSSVSAGSPNTFTAIQTFNDTMLALRNPANTFSLTLGAGAQTAARTATFPVLSANDTVVMLAASQTLSNKTLTSPVISSISNTGTLTLPTSSDTLVGRATTDTLTNKTITAASNTITDTSAAQGDILVHNGTRFVRLGKGTTNQVLASTGTTVAWTSFNNETVGTATASGNGSGTTFNIPHSLGSTPYMALIQCSSHSTAFTFTYNSTNIVVTFTTAPPSGTNNVIFQWKVVA